LVINELHVNEQSMISDS